MFFFNVFVGLVEAFFVFWGVLFVILGFPFSLFWIVLGWVNGGTCFGFNTCERKALVNSIPHRNSVYHHPTLGAWRLRGWMCQRDCHCPTNAISLELFVAFWHLQHFSKRRRKGIRQNMLSGKFRGQKTAEKGGKTAEKEGLWKLSSCRKHAQKVLPRILVLF